MDAIALVRDGRSVTSVHNVTPPVMECVSEALASPRTHDEPKPVTLSGMVHNAPETCAESVTTVTLDVPEPERVQILTLAKAGHSRREISKQVYGVIGGSDYPKIKAVLDAAGL